MASRSYFAMKGLQASEASGNNQVSLRPHSEHQTTRQTVHLGNLRRISVG